MLGDEIVEYKYLGFNVSENAPQDLFASDSEKTNNDVIYKKD